MNALTLLFPELYRLALAEQRAVFAGETVRRRPDGKLPHPCAIQWCDDVYESTPDLVQVRFVGRLIKILWRVRGGDPRALEAPRGRVAA